MQKYNLFFQVGPIAVTSANPTGEADTTHHNQVYAKLGDKVRTLFQFYNIQTPKDLASRLKGAFCFVRWMECCVMEPPQRTLHPLWLTALRLNQGILVSSEWVSFLNLR